MFAAEFEKHANLMGKIFQGAGSLVGKVAPVRGQRLIAKGEKMVQSGQAAKAKAMTQVKSEQLQNRMKATNEARKMRGQEPRIIDKKKIDRRVAAMTTKKQPGAGVKPAADNKGGFFGFVRRNPVTSAGLAGGAGYMIGKPSNDQQYQSQPMIQ